MLHALRLASELRRHGGGTGMETEKLGRRGWDTQKPSTKVVRAGIQKMDREGMENSSVSRAGRLPRYRVRQSVLAVTPDNRGRRSSSPR